MKMVALFVDISFSISSLSVLFRLWLVDTGICIVLIYLILCAFYESFLIPIAVIISVPCGIMGSFLFAKLFGLENNIYLQTGVIMLIGLLAKTAILITEYASSRRKAGFTIKQSAIGAAKVRLRPILMTALFFERTFKYISKFLTALYQQ